VKFFKPNQQALNYARRGGIEHANECLLRELSYAVSIHKLLRQPGTAVPEKWATAFELLFAEVVPFRFPDEATVGRLLELGFTEQNARYMVSSRHTAPEGLVVQLLAVMSGIPEPEVWGVTRNI
jgi:hypothetical protein